MTIAPETRCLNCGNDSPCGCSEPMPAADAYAAQTTVEARYKPLSDLTRILNIAREARPAYAVTALIKIEDIAAAALRTLGGRVDG